MSRHGDGDGDTKQRVLESACGLFAEKGYRDTTVHEICEKANANIAAVNYYFGSKDELFVAACEHAYELSSEAGVLGADLTEGRASGETLEAFIRARVRAMFATGPTSYLWRISMHMHSDANRARAHGRHEDPRGLRRELHKRIIEPTVKRLDRLMAALVGVSPEDPHARMFAFSLLAQIMALGHPHHKRPCQHVFGKEHPDEADIEMLCDHLTRLLLTGIRETRAMLEATAAEAAAPEATTGKDAAHS